MNAKTKSNTAKKTNPKQATTVQVKILDKIESFLNEKSRLILAGTILLAAIASLLLFKPDVSLGGDDSAYIKSGYQFAHGISFPGWHGSLYSMLLSLFISLFGVNIVLLKFTSLLFFLAAFVFLYQIFAKVTNHLTATTVVVLTAVNYLLCDYASTTYSEPFFFFLQSLYIFLMYKYTCKQEGKKETIKNIWPGTLALGALTYALIQTRSVAMVVFLVSLAFLLLEKKYLSTLLYSGFTLATHLLFGLYKRLAWHITKIGFEDQSSGIMLKNFYKPQEGNEDFIGLIHRFWDNSELYLSKHLTRMFGLKSLTSITTNKGVTIFLFILFILASIYVIRKNKKMSLIILYLATMIGASFLSLQKHWDQERLIMIYFPFIIGVIFFALFHLFQQPRFSKQQAFPIVLAVILFFTISHQIFSKRGAQPIENRFSAGSFDSYTPDWKNYMLASRWAGKNVPDTAVIVCRKPDMSWIASSGKGTFTGIYRLETNNPDSVIMNLKNMKAQYVIMGNLRLNPLKNTGQTISTIRNTLALATYKYPACLTLIKDFGSEEKAYLFKIDFADKMPESEYMKNLDAAIIVNPKNQQIIITKANYLLSRKQLEAAVAYYNMAINNNSKETIAFFNRGICYFQLSKFNEAISDFKKATSLKKDYGEAYFNLAACYYNTGDYNNSFNALKDAEKNGFNNAEVLNLEKMLRRN